MQEEDGTPLIRALLRPEAYAFPTGAIEVRETHISWVVLAGPYAYKIKKPVFFGFLDFRTVERRAADCHEEVRLNRRLCPDVYLGVVDVVERGGRYYMGGEGRPVESVVWMRRLPEDGMLTTLLTRRLADAPLVRRIARTLARFHSVTATGPGVDEHGTVRALRANWEENFVQTKPLVGRVLSPVAQQTVERYVETFLDSQRVLLERRVADGRIRDGHGDLHAGSICVEGRRLHLFDCLEFTPRFRCGDVATEVAFLAMDLDHHGRADLSRAFLDAYVAASGDDDLPRLLDFYRCYRAYVRAKVQGFRLLAATPGSAEARQFETRARSYFDLAWAYAGGLGPPMLVGVVGLPASGKSTLAEGLAGRFGLLHLSSDMVRKELAGRAPTFYAGAAFQQGLYARGMTRRTYRTLRVRARRWLRAGRSVVLDATYGNPSERAAVRRLTERAGARLLWMVCEADEGTLRARLAGREDDAGLTSDARVPLWPALRASFAPPTELAETVTVDTTARPEVVIERAVEAVKQAARQR